MWPLLAPSSPFLFSYFFFLPFICVLISGHWLLTDQMKRWTFLRGVLLESLKIFGFVHSFFNTPLPKKFLTITFWLWEFTHSLDFSSLFLVVLLTVVEACHVHCEWLRYKMVENGFVVFIFISIMFLVNEWTFMYDVKVNFLNFVKIGFWNSR